METKFYGETGNAAREVHRLSVSPAINTYESDKEFLVELEMPGTDKKDIAISLEGEELVVSSAKKAGYEGFSLIHEESLPVEYRRSLRLGPDVDSGSIQAVYENGILILKFRKSEKALPKKIVVQ